MLRTQILSEKIQKHFCVSDANFASATNVACARKQGNICVRNNVSSFAGTFLRKPLWQGHKGSTRDAEVSEKGTATRTLTNVCELTCLSRTENLKIYPMEILFKLLLGPTGKTEVPESKLNQFQHMKKCCSNDCTVRVNAFSNISTGMADFLMELLTIRTLRWCF